MKEIPRENTKESQNHYRLQKSRIFQTYKNHQQTTNTMDFKNTRHSLSNRISKRERQHRSECPNQKRKQDHFKRKKNISKRVNTKTSQKTRILFSIKCDSIILTKRVMKI